jgi:hypothetical protein
LITDKGREWLPKSPRNDSLETDAASPVPHNHIDSQAALFLASRRTMK